VADAVIALADETATAALAARIAVLAQSDDVIALRGDLGTGKSVFARAFIRARCGFADDIPSPTFTLVQIYDGAAGDVCHFDLYRLQQPEEALELGFEEALQSGIVLIEWPERLGPLLPDARLDVFLSFGDIPESRVIRFAGSPAWMTRLKEAALV
jgi:tRNA threonylcarbamoyladenosine biosynthesis protein TsaE